MEEKKTRIEKLNQAFHAKTKGRRRAKRAAAPLFSHLLLDFSSWIALDLSRIRIFIFHLPALIN